MKSTQAFLRLLNTVPRFWVLGLLALMILASLTEGVGILLLVPMLEMLGNGASDHSWIGLMQKAFRSTGLSFNIEALLLAFVVLVCLRSSIQYAREQVGAVLQHRLVDQLRQQCFAALLAVEWRWLVNTRRADHANLLLGDISRVGVGLNFGLSLLASLVTIGAYLATAFVLSWRMTLIALATGGVAFFLLAGQRRHALNLGQSLGRANRALHGNVQESLAGIKLAKILGTEWRHLDHFIHTTERLRTQQLAFSASNSLSRALLLCVGASLLATYLYAGLSVWHTPVPILLTLVLIFSRLIPQFMTGQQQLHHWLHAMPALEETWRLLADCRGNAEPGLAKAPDEWPIRDGVSLNDVSMTYSERSEPALANVSLCFPVRTTTAIMGASGAGKSTLADVLMGLLSPDHGELRVDDRLISGDARIEWRRHVAYVPQEVFLFHDTIRNNLLWGNSMASEDALRRCLEQAAAEFVFQLPEGLDTVVGDGGVRLSGGERQRLALARALLRRPSLLILDEATSALDVANEARIRTAIEQLHGDLTVVIIGHRLPTLEHADQVVILDHGRVVAQGPWSAVRNVSGLIDRR